MKAQHFSRVLLVGFMGAGKTRVGRELARRLGWRFFDFDDVIEAEFGLPIYKIFADHGERRFREVEKRVAERLLAEREVVLASGGGWAVGVGHLEGVAEETATIWLQVSAEEAVRRTATCLKRRPLLPRDTSVDVVRALLEERTPFYAAAEHRVDTERLSVEDVSAWILDILASNDLETKAE